MKKILVLLLPCIFLSVRSWAQNPQQDTLDRGLGNTQRLATGALQDVLNNYLQVAAKNITSTNSGLQIKINWFALNGMDSVQKYKNENFIKNWWQRNGEFVASLGLDNSGKVKSWQAGFNYNLLNRRDTAMHRYTVVYAEAFPEEVKIQQAASARFQGDLSPELEKRLAALLSRLYLAAKPVSDLKTQLNKHIPGMFHGGPDDKLITDKIVQQLEADLNTNPAGSSTLTPAMIVVLHNIALYESSETINNSVNDYTSGKGLVFPTFVTAGQVAAIDSFLNDQVKNNPILHGKLKANTIAEANKIVIRSYQELVQYISRQSLLTASYLFTKGNGAVLTNHEGGFTYLQGLGKFRSAKTGQIKASLTDTLTSNDPTGKIRNFSRNIIALQGGYNQVLATQNKKSLLEINIAAEFDWATKGYIINADDKRFYLDAYFRARLPTTPWLKFSLKYDPKGGNVFGFFDLTYNLDK